MGRSVGIVRDKKSGVYYFRKDVPPELRPLLERREWKKSLRTKDLNEAKVLHAREHVACLDAFAAAREGRKPTATLLNLRDAYALSAVWLAGRAQA